MKIKITRTAYCAKCAQAERPKTDNIFVLHGSRGYHIHTVNYAIPHYNPIGFVPHVFELDKSIDGFITGTKTCCMHECGFTVVENHKYESGDESNPYLIYTNEKSPFKMTIKDWNALVLSKEFGYKIE